MTHETKPVESGKVNLWQRAARSTAIVGAVFAGIFTALLIANLIGTAVLGPSQENGLEAMKLQVQKDPANETLLSAIRQLDLKIRRDRIWRLDFAYTTAYALLGSVLVFLIAGRITHDLGKRAPHPQHMAERGEMQVKEAKQARWAVIGGLAAPRDRDDARRDERMGAVRAGRGGRPPVCLDGGQTGPVASVPRARRGGRQCVHQHPHVLGRHDGREHPLEEPGADAGPELPGSVEGSCVPLQRRSKRPAGVLL